MRSVALAAALTALTAGVQADLCTGTSKQINGNWYCQAVQRISYHGVGGRGTYKKVTGFNENTRTCSSVDFDFEGSLAPMDEDISFHFRGPVQLKQFAVYVPGASTQQKARSAKRTIHERRLGGHGHSAFHKRKDTVVPNNDIVQAEKRAVGDLVIATINGQVVSWINEYSGEPTPAVAVPAQNPSAAQATQPTVGSPSVVSPSFGSPSVGRPAQEQSRPKPSPSQSAPQPAGTGDWTQIAYYNAEQAIADGLVFLGHYGGQGSGVFDYAFGNSLSYLGSDGVSGCASPEVLRDVGIPSNKEFAIFSDKPCDGDNCGFVRPGTVAYEGFGGPSKAFFMEFSMPDDGRVGWNENMPAIWTLNAQIPRTLQYGDASCSCWTSGCGEFDLFEVLDSGNTRCKSTYHGPVHNQGGDSNYFVRPTSKTIKAAMVMHEGSIHIEILDDDTTFGASKSTSSIMGIADDARQNILTSIFDLA
ncbi:hypothetical protein M501DRAFT_980460 [Patellaria atrata CBS 101060]|uniref:glucan endo-1,3-beta-D-glucosidase n=1 Tax=Patellaria atrata CBS 101060 TaxID=1346257 RepID=A0A9P4S644_9PEZI|nr:hypothetical protein M501DRAFT_980460 [Patellaria atrata CBS 101060]